MEEPKKPCLYGISHSNRSNLDLWGKNQFNSSFPIALACYMRDHDQKAVYLKLDKNLKIVPEEISFNEVFNSQLPNDKLYFSFESKFEPYQKYASDDISGIDLVVKSTAGEFLRPLEIKLTVLPDSGTSVKEESLWGSEIVIRPATTKYCALGIADSCFSHMDEIRSRFEPIGIAMQDWGNRVEVSYKMEGMLKCINTFEADYLDHQKPVLLQPIWKTQGQSPMLAKQAFDIFVWSDFALSRLFLDSAWEKRKSQIINRQMRSTARFFRFMYQMSTSRKVALSKIYHEMDFSRQTDKEFAVGGNITNRYMASPRLLSPLLPSSIIPEIILNGGEERLKPERRFDQTLYFTAKEKL
ncbi:MAG: HindVP family restriction endonuclease [Victivallaceae bacterium]|nr:HindVP family restriction endonuclease [Victivallaceae bacterium]